ncbi:MAG: hypothetical protein ACRCV9_02135, partial [Burkholderiaceae bacterium]
RRWRRLHDDISLGQVDQKTRPPLLNNGLASTLDAGMQRKRIEAMYPKNQNISSPAPSMLAEAGQCPRLPEVARERADLMIETDRLAGAVKELIDKLWPVIRAAPPTEIIVGTKREDCDSQLGIEIREASDRLRTETARLRCVLEALAI